MVQNLRKKCTINERLSEDSSLRYIEIRDGYRSPAYWRRADKIYSRMRREEALHSYKYDESVGKPEKTSCKEVVLED